MSESRPVKKIIPSADVKAGGEPILTGIEVLDEQRLYPYDILSLSRPCPSEPDHQKQRNDPYHLSPAAAYKPHTTDRHPLKDS